LEGVPIGVELPPVIAAAEVAAVDPGVAAARSPAAAAAFGDTPKHVEVARQQHRGLEARGCVTQGSGENPQGSGSNTAMLHSEQSRVRQMQLGMQGKSLFENEPVVHTSQAAHSVDLESSMRARAFRGPDLQMIKVVGIMARGSTTSLEVGCGNNPRAQRDSATVTL